MRTIPSPHYERSTLFESDLDKYEAERSLYRNLLRAETAIKEGARKRRHLQLVPSDAGRCHGESCHQGRQPCREHCNQLKEMSVYAPDDENETDKAGRDVMLAVLAFVAWLMLLAIIAPVLGGGFVWLSHHYVAPILAALGRVLN